MKTILLLLLIVTFTSFKGNDKSDLKNGSSHWLITESSSLTVNGSTNINKFSCSIINYSKTDTITVSEDKINTTMLSGAVNIEVKNFDCNNYMMTKELRKTLKEKEFPYLSIKFLSLTEIGTNQKLNNLKGSVTIEIAGVVKCFEICYQLTREKNKMILIGNQPINFSHFNLRPPHKMGRLVKARDELIVVFYLTMEAI